MIYPTISEYIESIKYAEDNFATLTNLRPVFDEDGNPIMSSGNFAVVFKMQDVVTKKCYAVKCFTREQEGRKESYKLVAEELSKCNSRYIVPIKYLDKELFVDNQTDEKEFPVLLMDWVEGQTLSSFLKDIEDTIENSICKWSNEEDVALFELKCLPLNFIRMASWLLKQPFAHGDIKPDNIILKSDGTLVLVDYDGVYTPSMKGKKRQYYGTQNYVYPLTDQNEFNKQIDNYAISIIALSLCAFSIKPQLLLSVDDYCIVQEKEIINLSALEILRDSNLMSNSLFIELLGVLLHTLSQNTLDPIYFENCVSSHLTPKSYDYYQTSETDDEADYYWEDEYGVRYSLDGRKVLRATKRLEGVDYRIREGAQVICDRAFQNRGLHSIILPNSIVSIGGVAFANNDDMEYCNIPSSVKYICKNNPWGGCFNIKQMDCQSPYYILNDGILYSDDFQIAYGFIYWHPYVTIHPKTRTIAINAFWSSRQNYKLFIKSIDLANVEDVGDSAFNCCVAAVISLPDTLRKIGNKAFYGCKNMKIANLISVDVIPTEAFRSCSGLKEVVLSPRLEVIKDEAFAWCTSLESIRIPKATKYISVSSLRECSSLRDINVDKDNEIYSSIDGVIFNKSITTLIKYPAAKEQKEYIIPDSVVELARESFAKCQSLEAIIGERKLRKIGPNTFVNCSSINQCRIDLENDADSGSCIVLAAVLSRLSGDGYQYEVKAFEYVEKSANMENSIAQLFLAKCYRRGWLNQGVDLQKCIYWLEKAAINGNYEAKCILGIELMNGNNITQNHERAYRLFVSIMDGGMQAEANCKGRHYNPLGIFYAKGIIVDKDLKLAVKFFQEGAQWKDPSAEFNLARSYERGFGVDVDLNKAKELYQRAREHGHDKAQAALDRIELKI